MKRLSFGLGGALLGVMLAASLATADGYKSADAHSQKNIVETAIGAGTFGTLVDLIKKAGLADTLSGPGPFTVFAPTDEAFAKVPAATLQSLATNPEKLKAVLTYHVIPKKLTAADVTNASSATTVQGSSLAISSSGGTVKVDEATVTSTDIMTSNGIIHVIDQVIMPAS